MKTATNSENTIVWDLFVRVFHWGLVSCVLLNYFVVHEHDALHHYLGYTACTFVLLRAVWGFVGGQFARFSSFWPSLRNIKAQLKQLSNFEFEQHLGHSPLGAVMMLLLVSCVLLLGLTGWVQTLELFDNEWLEVVHEVIANSMMGLVALHVLAAIVMGRLERVNLIKAMFTGKKKFDV
jgi:cytochrome b